MSDEIKPALTPEEWEKPWVFCPFRGGNLYVDERGDNGALRVNFDGAVYGSTLQEITTTDRHALAALCLYQQLFGFTQEDVTALNATIVNLREYLREHAYPHERIEGDSAVRRLTSLTARIAALLPPIDSESQRT